MIIIINLLICLKEIFIKIFNMIMNKFKINIKKKKKWKLKIIFYLKVMNNKIL